MYQTKYGLGTIANILYDPNDNKAQSYLLESQKFGFLYQVKALDPSFCYYLPIGPKPLPFAAKEVDAEIS